jgi:hypothetical protein
MTDKETTLVVQGIESESCWIGARVPQGSSLSLILFLFYNAKLLDLCCNPTARTLAVRFVDDVNILVYSPNTEGNCRQLETIHKKCLN